MADIVIKAAYGSVVEEDGTLFVGFAEGEEEDEPYVLFSQPLAGGPVRLEVNDEGFAAEDAVAAARLGPKGLDLTIAPGKERHFGWACSVGVRIGPGCEDAEAAIDALRGLIGARFQG